MLLLQILPLSIRPPEPPGKKAFQRWPGTYQTAIIPRCLGTEGCQQGCRVHLSTGRVRPGAKFPVLAHWLAVGAQGPLQAAVRRNRPDIHRQAKHPRRHTGMRQTAIPIPLPPVAAIDGGGRSDGQGADIKLRILPLADAKARRAARIKRIIDKPAFPAQHFGNGLLEQGIGIIGVMIHV